MQLAAQEYQHENNLLREKLDNARHRQLMLEQKMAALEAGVNFYVVCEEQ